MSRASACINSLRLISETPLNTTARRPGSENDNIHAIVEYIEPLCYHPSMALRASCITGLVVRESLIPFADLDVKKIQTKKFPDLSTPLFNVIRLWKFSEISQWSRLDLLTTTSHPPPGDHEMWADVAYDAPLIHLAISHVPVKGMSTSTWHGKQMKPC